MEPEIKTILHRIEGRFTPLEESIQRTNARFIPLEESIQRIESRLTPLEGIEERLTIDFDGKMDSKIDTFAILVSRSFDNIHLELQEFRKMTDFKFKTIMENQDRQFKDWRQRFDGLSNRIDYIQDQITE
ncbi:MAG: hypothetical protein JWL80_654 [Parcubacteria group bacterium]|nr:hypothetical protein [Parcubacteria group bacterium]